MNILIPVDDSDLDEANISLIDDLKYWLLLEFVDGKVVKTEFYQNRDEISDWTDIVIVKNDKEYVWPFMEEGMMVLLAPHQNSIDEIVEAYKFKELYDLNINM